MRVEQLREIYTDDELATVYPRPYRHDRWPDHIERVEATISFAREHLIHGIGRVADLSCGDGAIARALDPEPVLGDLVGDWGELTGPITETIERIGLVDTFILSETLEHLPVPWVTLWAVRQKARQLVLTTPVGHFDDTNPEHYWAWDAEFVEKAAEPGWTPHAYRELDLRHHGGYLTGMWVMR